MYICIYVSIYIYMYIHELLKNIVKCILFITFHVEFIYLSSSNIFKIVRYIKLRIKFNKKKFS